MPDETTSIPQTPQTEAPTEPVLAPEPTPEPQMAQIPPSEPLSTEPEAETPEIPEPEPTDPKPQTPAPTESQPTPEPPPQQTQQPIPVIIPPTNPIRELLTKAREAIQTRKRKKLDKIMGMFTTKQKITNDEVEKLLHVSDATATRYLSILKKEGKIQQIGKTGKSVSYSKI